MNLRIAAAFFAVLGFLPGASAQTPDLAAIARSSGTPEIPGLKMVWLSPWGDVASAHPWKNIIVHQTNGRLRKEMKSVIFFRPGASIINARTRGCCETAHPVNLHICRPGMFHSRFDLLMVR